jgi:hypothetical protein
MAQPKLPTLAGQWVGLTIGHSMPAHLWQITQQGFTLAIATRWEHTSAVTMLRARLSAEGTAFSIGPFRAVVLGPQHFVVPGWDTNDARGGRGPHFDVIFARPGIAELAAPTRYRHYRAEQALP